MGFMDCEIVFVVGLCIGLLLCCLAGGCCGGLDVSGGLLFGVLSVCGLVGCVCLCWFLVACVAGGLCSVVWGCVCGVDSRGLFYWLIDSGLGLYCWLL